MVYTDVQRYADITITCQKLRKKSTNLLLTRLDFLDEVCRQAFHQQILNLLGLSEGGKKFL